MLIQLNNIYKGKTKDVKLGFSWTSLFFGPLIPLFRGDILWTILYIVLFPITAGFIWLIFPFLYNKIYIKKLVGSGWQAANELSKNMLMQNGIFTNVAVKKDSEKNTTSFQNQDSSETDNKEIKNNEIMSIIKSLLDKYPDYKKTWINGNIPEYYKDKLMKKMPNLNLNNETPIFAGIYGPRKKINYAVIITNKNFHYRLAKGMMKFAKSNVIPINSIYTIEAEHSSIDIGGPIIKVNNNMIGFMQVLFQMSDDDEQILIELLNEINRKGLFIGG